MRSLFACLALAAALTTSAGAASARVIRAPGVNISTQVEHTYLGYYLDPPDFLFEYRTSPGTLSVQTDLDLLIGSVDFSGLPTVTAFGTGVRPLNSGFTITGGATGFSWLVEAPSIEAADRLELQGDAVHASGQYTVTASGLGGAQALIVHQGGSFGQYGQELGFARCQPEAGEIAGCGTHDFDVALTLFRVTETLFTGKLYLGASAYTRGELLTTGPYDAAASAQMSIYLDSQFLAQNPGFTVTSAVLSDIQVDGAPEPGAWALLILGFGATGVILRRQRRAERTRAIRPATL